MYYPQESVAGLWDATRRGTAYYLSHDGGASWALSSDLPGGVDPACAYANDGTVYTTTMMPDSVYQTIRGILLETSRDHGKTWIRTLTPTARGRYLDRQWVAVDNTGGPHDGTMYFNAVEYTQSVRPDSTIGMPNRSADILVFRSVDRGRTLDATLVPGAHADSGGPYPGLAPGQIVVLSNGTVVTSHLYFHQDSLHRTNSSGSRVAVSQDGGRTFSYEFPISGPTNEVRGPGAELALHTWAMLAVDLSNGPYRDRVYAVWPSSVGGRARLWMAYTKDRNGRRWTTPEPIDEATATNIDSLWLGPNNVNPAVAVNGQGVVAVSWAARGPAMTAYLTPRIMASLDGGNTWSRSVELAPSMSYTLRDRTLAASSGGARSGLVTGGYRTGSDAWSVALQGRWRALEAGGHKEVADFWGIMADAAGAFHGMWLDTRSGVAQLWIWTAPVTVTGPVHAVRDVTDQLRPEFSGWQFDSATSRLSVDVQSVNVGTQSLAGPIVLKWIGEPDGPLMATNADNGWAGPGAVWQVPVDQNAGTSLEPGRRTARRRLEFRARGPNAVRAAMQIRAFVYAAGPVS
jgi:hypothetical protein